MKEQLESIKQRLHKVNINDNEVLEFEMTLQELKDWLLFYSYEEPNWEWSTKAIFENLDFYRAEVDYYQALPTAEEKKHKFPMLKASIAMEIAELQRYLT
jgi:hypothetical protein